MKILVDILMCILLILEFSKGYMIPLIHEIIGILLFILLIIHLYLNKAYLKNIFNGKYNISRYIMIVTNIVLFIAFMLSILFGILSSQELLSFMNVNNINIIKMHKVFSYITLIIVGIHLGINFNAMFSKLKINKLLLYILDIIIIFYGVYSFIKLDIVNHVIGTFGFSINNGPLLINIIDYLSIVLSIAIIVKYLDKFIKNRRKNER